MQSDPKIGVCSGTRGAPPAFASLLHTATDMPNEKKIELRNDQRQSAFLLLWGKLVDGKLPHGVFQEIAEIFGVNATTISRLWRKISKKIEEELELSDDDEDEGKDKTMAIITKPALYTTRRYLRGRKHVG